MVKPGIQALPNSIITKQAKLFGEKLQKQIMSYTEKVNEVISERKRICAPTLARTATSSNEQDKFLNQDDILQEYKQISRKHDKQIK